MNNNQTIWTPLKGYENNYIINLEGIVKNKIGHILSTRINIYGYVEIRISKDGIQKTTFMHRLLALTYLPNPKNYAEVNHKNGIKTDNSIGNLEWVSRLQNMQHATEFGLLSKCHNCRSLIDGYTGMIFYSVKEAAEYNFLPYKTLGNYLQKDRYNPTSLRYLDIL